MNRATSNLFMVSSDSGIVSPVLTSPTIYPLVLKAAIQESNTHIKVARLIRLAELSYGKRDYESLKQIANLLAATQQGQDAGLYYLALIEQASGRLETALTILEPLTRYASPIFRSRAIMSYAATNHLAGDVTAATTGYLEAIRVSGGIDLPGLCTAFFHLSFLKSQNRDHCGAIECLERVWPFVRYASQYHPHLFYGFHNDLSYELAEIGRIDQALEHSTISCSSPLVEKYPEWKATEQEIKQKREAAEHKPVIIIIQKPEPEPQPEPVVVIPVPVICFHSPKSYKINLRGSICLTRAPANTLQLERIKYSITPRGPPQFHTP